MADDSENGPKNAITIFGKLDAPLTGTPAEPLTIDLAAIETPIDPPKAEAIGPDAAAASPGVRWDRFSPLAASIVTALLVGAFAGASATYELSRQAIPVVASAPAGEGTLALQGEVTRLSKELAAIKAGVESASRTSTQQFTRIGERLERAEKAQAEPASKIAKIAESLERLERRAAAAPDVTGSVTSVEKQDSKPPTVEGWKLRDYYAGRAVLESRNGTLFEVGPGSNLPGVGKVETIKRVDGKIVVTTPKGVITSSLDLPRRYPY